MSAQCAHVLLKDIEDAAFVFYTNYGSAKAQEIEAAGKAAFVMHWKSLRRQIRVRGVVTRGGRAAGGFVLCLAFAQEPTRGLGLEPVAAARIAHRTDGGSGKSDSQARP